MGYLKKHALVLIALAVLICLYLVVRVNNLTSLPLFTDESIYIRWAQIGVGDPYYRFLSLTDGKQPLFIWVMYPFLKVFDDPLVAGRMVSVFSGLVTMIGLGLVSWELFKKKSVALLTMVIYLFYPFAQVMDRIALYDSMVAMFSVLTLYVSILFVRHIRLDIAYTLGVIFGLGILTKTSNFLSIYFLPLTLLLFNFKQSHWKKKLFQWAGLSLIALIISQVMYGVLRLSPLPNVISQKNNTFYYPLSEWIHNPFAYIIGNLQGLLPPLLEYLTVPYIMLIVVSLAFIKKDWKEKLMLAAFFLLPFVGFALIAKSIFARYIFFMTMPLLLLAGWGLGYVIDFYLKKSQAKGVRKLVVQIAVIMVFVFYPAYISLSFAQNPLTAPIAKADKSQYVTAWTGGWGLNETVSFLQEQARDKQIYVATEGTFGLYPQGIELYLSQNKNINIKGYYWEITEDFPQEVAEKAKTTPTFFVFYQPCPGQVCPRPGDAPKGWPVKQVKEFLKEGTQTRVVIYQVTTNPQ